jgi:hypothetical protein
MVYSRLNSDSEIVIAGYPIDIIDELKELGLDYFIHVKSNLLEELEKFNSILVI